MIIPKFCTSTETNDERVHNETDACRKSHVVVCMCLCLLRIDLFSCLNAVRFQMCVSVYSGVIWRPSGGDAHPVTDWFPFNLWSSSWEHGAYIINPLHFGADAGEWVWLSKTTIHLQWGDCCSALPAAKCHFQGYLEKRRGIDGAQNTRFKVGLIGIVILLPY